MGDKWLAHVFFEQHGIDSPRSWLPNDIPDDVRYPVLVKIREGFGSRHIYRATTAAELAHHLERAPVDSFVQELCLGEEFSIDVFCDREGRCLNAVPRTMIQSKGGESIKGPRSPMTSSSLTAPGSPRRSASSARPASSASASPTAAIPVTDVNPRFGGAFPLPTAAGSRYPELALALARGEQPEPRLGDFRAGVVMTRFFSDVCLIDDGTGALVPYAGALARPVIIEPT